MSTLLHDLRYGLRMLAKNPGFAAVAVLSLALGIGANTTIFSIVDKELLNPWPVKDPGRLAMITMDSPKLDFNSTSYPSADAPSSYPRFWNTLSPPGNLFFRIKGLDISDRI